MRVSALVVSASDPASLRAARRAALRADFVPPGPAPAAPPGLVPAPDETLDALVGAWRIFQLRQGHRFSADDLLVAHFAGETARALGPAPRRLLDLGAGIGSVGLMVLWQYPSASLTLVEAQARSRELAARSVVWNGVADRVELVEGDLRAFEPRAADFDLVTGSPPYFDTAAGVVSDRPQRAPCRFELRGGVEGYVQAMGRALAPEGIGALVMTQVGLDRIRASAETAGLRVIRERAVVFKAGRAPHLVLVALRRKETPPSFEDDGALDAAPLVLRAADDTRTEAFRRIRLEMGYPPRMA